MGCDIACIGWGGSDWTDLLPPPKGATDEVIKEYKAAARKLVHSLVLQLGLEFKEEWWANPWRPSIMGSALLTSDFCTMVTKEAVYDPPRPTPIAAQDTINEHVMEQVRSGISCFGSSPWNFNVLAIKKAENKYDGGKPRFRLAADLRLCNAQCIRTHHILLPCTTILEQVSGQSQRKRGVVPRNSLCGLIAGSGLFTASRKSTRVP